MKLIKLLLLIILLPIIVIGDADSLLSYDYKHKDCPHYKAEMAGYKYNMANCLVDDVWGRGLVAYASKSLPMKIDTIKTDTVGYEKILIDSNFSGLHITGAIIFYDSSWVPILEYITDTTYILTSSELYFLNMLRTNQLSFKYFIDYPIWVTINIDSSIIVNDSLVLFFNRNKSKTGISLIWDEEEASKKLKQWIQESVTESMFKVWNTPVNNMENK